MTTYLFNVVVDFKDGDPFVLKRTLEAFEVFADDLSGFSFPDDIKNTQAILTKTSSLLDQNVKRSCPVSAIEVQNFLNHCLQDPGIVRSRALADFLWDPLLDGEGAHPPLASPMTAIDFILQPFENQSVYIPRYEKRLIEKQDRLVILCAPSVYSVVAPNLDLMIFVWFYV